MTKNLKLNIKNPQIAGAINLSGLKAKLAKKKSEEDVELPAKKGQIAAAKKKEKTSTEIAEAQAGKKPKPRPKAKTTEAESSVSGEALVKAEAKAEVQAKPIHPKPTPPKSVEPKFEVRAQVPPKVEAKAGEKSELAFQRDTHAPVRAKSEAPSVPPTTSTVRVAAPQALPPAKVEQPRPPSFKADIASAANQPPFRSSQSWSSRPQQEKARESQPSTEGFGTARKAPTVPAKPTWHHPSSTPQPSSEQAVESQPQVRTPRPPHQEGQRPPYQEGQRPPYQGSRPPYQEGQRPPYQGNRPPYQEGQRPPYQGSRPPYQEGQRPPYQGNRPPYQEGQRPPYQGNRPPYQEGQRPPYQEGQRPPYQGSRPGGYGPPRDRPPGDGAPRGPSSYQDRPYPPRDRSYPPGGAGGRPPYPPGSRPPYAGPRSSFAPKLPFPGDDKPAFAKRETEFKPKTDEARGPKSFADIAKQRAKAKESQARKPEMKAFDPRTRHGFVPGDDDDGGGWRRRKQKSAYKGMQEKEIVRPTKIKVRLPISIKDLAAEMKLKASELISKLFIQGVILTLNDSLDDPAVVGLLGHDFGCEVTVDTEEEERIRISGKNVKEEIAAEDANLLITRSPVIAFMGHVDHGKTSLIDVIRKSNRAAKEVGAITQHIGAFKCVTSQGPITVLDTPGHEAFTLMRERGAHVTDIVVLVIAGDEGIQEQTIEAIKQAREAKATIVVALTKCDKPNFDQDHVFRQLADQNLLPEPWGGQTIVVNTSSVTGAGVQELLEMLALQSEVLELKANPSARARGTVIESEIRQGMGAMATVLVQNGTLRSQDALVFGVKWAKVKSMRDEMGKELAEAGPSTPVQITGLSGLPEAGEEFIVVKSEKEAREIAEARQEGRRESSFQVKKRRSFESLMESASHVPKKVLPVVLRADVQGSLEALTKALERIKSDKVEVNVIAQGVGQISESDAELAFASHAVILGFHTSVEAHAESVIKEMGVKVLLHNIIYHAVDGIKELMKGLLEKLPQEVEKGKAEVRAIFKASQLGIIAGCFVTEGTITRSSHIRLKRAGTVVWKGLISSLKRVKDDVREVQKGLECGICLQSFGDVQVGDILEAYEVIYIEQEL